MASPHFEMRPVQSTSPDAWRLLVSPTYTYASRPRKPCRIVNRCLEGERGDRTDPRCGHEPADLRILASQFHSLAVKLTNLLLDSTARFEQRSDRSHQLGTALDQFLGSHGKDIKLGTADDEAEIFEKAANMVD